MPTKVGAGGHQQNYDSHGRYCKTNYFNYERPKESKREKQEERRKKGDKNYTKEQRTVKINIYLMFIWP